MTEVLAFEGVTLTRDGNEILRGIDFHVDGADYVRIAGFTITNAQKGLMADGTVGSVFEALTVHHTGDEAIHLRNFSTDNVVRGNVIYAYCILKSGIQASEALVEG